MQFRFLMCLNRLTTNVNCWAQNNRLFYLFLVLKHYCNEQLYSAHYAFYEKVNYDY